MCLHRSVILAGVCVLSAASAPAFASDGPSATPDGPIHSRAAASLARLFVAPALTAVDSPPPLSDALAQQASPPPPRHTGISALFRGVGSDFKAFPRRKSTYVILGIGGAAALLAHPADDDVNVHLAGDGAGKFFAAGKWIGYAYIQTGVAVGTWAIGRYVLKPPEGKSNKVSHLGFDLLRANILAQAFTYGIKYAVQRDRPNGDCCSFPSGHASVTFATAAVLERHLGYRNAWPTFLVAGYVAASRLHENRHFVSDVLFGSALGIASGWTVVGRHGRDDYAMMATPLKGGGEVTLTWTPHARHAE